MSRPTFRSIKSDLSFEDLLKQGRPAVAERSHFNFEALPVDVIVDILHFLYSLDDLHNLIRTSKICYILSETYAVSIYTQVAKNHFGSEFWRDVSTLLIYQRNCGNGTILENSIAIQKDLQTPFTMSKRDVTQLINNQKFFQICYGESYHVPSLWGPRIPGARMIKHFYQIWLLALRFQYESIRIFATREPLLDQQSVFFSRVVNTMCRSSPFRGTYDSPFQKQDYPTGIFTVWNMRSAQRSRRRIPAHINPNTNGLLFMKMLFRISETPGWNYETAGVEFMIDYVTTDTTAMVEKYGLDKGLE